MIRLLHGDCRDVMAQLAADSLDACVTDPPYHLTNNVGTRSPYPGQYTPIGRPREPKGGFMGKTWDGGDVAFQPDTWRGVWRVLKPGAYLVAMGGTRTQHRMVCAIEDAGFEVRDTLLFLYGTGFPKNHSVTKALGDTVCSCNEHTISTHQEASDDPMLGVREAVSSSTIACQEGETASLFLPMQRGSARQGMGDARSQGSSRLDESQRGQLPREDERPAQPSVERRHHLSAPQGPLCERSLRQMPTRLDRHGPPGRLRDGAPAGDGPMDRTPAQSDGMRASHRPQTAEQRAQQSGTLADQSEPQGSGAWHLCNRCGKPIVPGGFGTALKPAVELICLARKPLSERTVAANFLKHGVGALNIDACRVPSSESVVIKTSFNRSKEGGNAGWQRPWNATAAKYAERSSDKGRWPANVLHDGSDEVEAAFAAFGESTSVAGGMRGTAQIWGGAHGVQDRNGHTDTGTASRFYYSAKADKLDRADSRHPTVKPVSLMRWLVRLITAPGGTVIDPFAGSGTTGEAAMLEGFDALLIEQDAQHVADARHRINRWQGGDLPMFASAAD